MRRRDPNDTQPIDPASVDWSGPHGMPRQAVLDCRELLKCMAQAAKLTGLYAQGHPVPASAVEEAGRLLKRFFVQTQWAEITIGLQDGRWIINEAALAEAASLATGLADAFRAQALYSATIQKGARLYELAVLIEGLAPGRVRAEGLELADLFKQKGVRHIRINAEQYTRAGAAQRPAPVVESPIPERTRARKPDPAAAAPGAGFGAFIKGLVEQSVSDPQERAQIYADTVKVVKEALERRVSQQTRRLTIEKQAALNERDRAESVMGAVAEGKVVVDRDGRVLMMDPVAEEIVGKRLVDVAGKPLLDSVDQEAHIAAIAKELQLPPGRMAAPEVELAGNGPLQEAFRQSMALVQDEEGRVVGTYGILPYVRKFKEAMRMQEEFVSHVTHELKAPLASICSALELMAELSEGKIGPQEKRFLEISRRNSMRLRQMIDEILDFSKIQQGKMSVTPVDCEIGPMLREAADGLRPWASSKRVDIRVAPEEGEGRSACVRADHGRVVQVLTNLISNAIKATPEGGRITVSARPGEAEHAGALVIAVTDTGCGIAKQDQARVFKKFEQVRGGGRKTDGVGLGLAIVQQLVSLHQGCLWLESEPGRGAVFYFTLPLAQ